MDGRRWQVVLLVLVAVLIIGRELVGGPPSMNVWDVWDAIGR